MTTVVYSSGPVTPWMWKLREPSPSSRQKPRSAHMPRRLDQDVDALAAHEVLVAAGRDVLAQRVGDVGVDVVLRGAGGVVGRRLLAVDRAPREERAALGEVLRAPAGRVQHVVAEAQRAAGHRRRGVGQERQHVDLGVPEVVAAVAGAGHPLRRHAGLLGPGGRLRDLEEVPADRLLQRRLAVHHDVRPRPQYASSQWRCASNWGSTPSRHPVQGAAAPVDQLADGHPARGVVGDRSW